MEEVKRTEHKYILSYGESLLLRKNLDAVMPRDSHCTDPAGYIVRSLYFDTVTDDCCAQKEEGLRFHEKIRLRIYGSSDSIIKLESKQKQGELQTKRTLVISRRVCDALCAGDYQVLLELEDPLADYFYRRLSGGMVPKAIVEYRRIPYAIPTNNTRITFDYHIRATESCLNLFRPDLQLHPVAPEDVVIAEVKYNNFLLGYIKNTLRLMNHTEGSFSKYFSGRSFYRRTI
jgi:hypothetical protein